MVRAKNPSSSLEIFGLFFSSSSSFINVFFSFFVLLFVNIYWVASMAIPVGKWVGFVRCYSFFFFPCR